MNRPDHTTPDHETPDPLPRLIQAGMGIHVSTAHLANRTARLGALGMVSGGGLRHVVVEDVRRGDAAAIALARTFPVARDVDELLAFAPGGRRHTHAVPVDNTVPGRDVLPRRLSAIAAYVEVLRAKRGHRGKVGINVMWKLTLTALPSIYGAMLAGVDALCCGAGVPMELPDIVRRIREGRDLAYRPLSGTGTHAVLDIADDGTSSHARQFAPPRMIPILSNFAFCKRILDLWRRDHDGARPDAFVLEHHAAGGHNAPPRDGAGYTAQDDVAGYFERVRALGVPVYVAGDFAHGGTRADYDYWLARGAYGIQVGSRFALCTDSGLRAELRDRVLALNGAGAAGAPRIETRMEISPTGYPFKVVPLAGTTAHPETYRTRARRCDKLYLVRSHFATRPDGTTRETYLCPAMPAAQYARLGGDPHDTEGRVCLCNGLLSAAGHYSDDEAPLVTLGESGARVSERRSAREVVESILGTERVAANEARLTPLPRAS